MVVSLMIPGLGEVSLRLILAVLLGGIIGYERERERMAAGLRTHMLVSLGSTLAVLVGVTLFADGDGAARIAQGIITGIGFLGAGTIFFGGDRVHGLTTAASIWIVALIGMAIGFGFYMGALITTVLGTTLLLLRDDFFFKNKSVVSTAKMAKRK
ncbi:MAG: MgtC/SapB family protein [Nanoarchaeota archaeon]